MQFRMIITFLFVMVTVAQGDMLIEGFDNGIYHDKWETFQKDAYSAPWTVIAPDGAGRLQISKSADNDTITASMHLSAGIRSRFILQGDFSIFVDFIHDVFDVTKNVNDNVIFFFI